MDYVLVRALEHILAALSLISFSSFLYYSIVFSLLCLLYIVLLVVFFVDFFSCENIILKKNNKKTTTKSLKIPRNSTPRKVIYQQ